MSADPAGPFAGRVAVVTGGARGIGAATVRALLAGGAAVCVPDLDIGDGLVEGLTEPHERLQTIAIDLTRPDAPADVVGRTVERFGTLDVLVNNAGYYWDAPVHRMSDDQFAAMLEIHTLTPFRFVREALQRWRPAESEVHRKIVNVSSRAASRGLPGAANYAAAKAALVALTLTAARENAHRGINVNAVSFGPVRTRFGHHVTDGTVVRAGGREVPLGRAAPTPSAPDGAAPRRATMSGRAATPDEAAQAIVYLCSPQSDLVNGEVLQVNG